MIEIKENGIEQILEKEIAKLFKGREQERFIEKLKGNDENKELFNYVEKFAKEGNIQAEFALGCCYEIGKGVEKNIQQAIYWYRIAATKGHEQAKERLIVIDKKQ